MADQRAGPTLPGRRPWDNRQLRPPEDWKNRPPPKLSDPPPPKRPSAFAPLTPTSAELARAESTIDYVKRKYNEMVAYLECRYPNDWRTHMLRLNLTSINIQRGGGGGGDASFEPYSGRIELSTQGKSKADALFVFTHEVGHALHSFARTNNIHGADWLALHVWLANLVTKELGWRIEVPCSDCDFYLLCQKSQCPLCTWECPNRSPRGQQLGRVDRSQVSPDPGFVRYPRSTYNRVCVQKDLPFGWWKNLCTTYETYNRLPRRQRNKTAALKPVRNDCPMPRREDGKPAFDQKKNPPVQQISPPPKAKPARETLPAAPRPATQNMPDPPERPRDELPFVRVIR